MCLHCAPDYCRYMRTNHGKRRCTTGSARKIAGATTCRSQACCPCYNRMNIGKSREQCCATNTNGKEDKSLITSALENRWSDAVPPQTETQIMYIYVPRIRHSGNKSPPTRPITVQGEVPIDQRMVPRCRRSESRLTQIAAGTQARNQYLEGSLRRCMGNTFVGLPRYHTTSYCRSRRS